MTAAMTTERVIAMEMATTAADTATTTVLSPVAALWLGLVVVVVGVGGGGEGGGGRGDEAEGDTTTVVEGEEIAADRERDVAAGAPSTLTERMGTASSCSPSLVLSSVSENSVWS